MAIEITARHLNISEELQNFAREKAEALTAEFPKIEFVHVVLDEQRHQYIAEIIAQHKGMPVVESREISGNMRAAIDLAYENVEKQLRRHREKIVTLHQRGVK
jgi:putative sigma-54 modulation protein